jgi:hypothetical protein
MRSGRRNRHAPAFATGAKVSEMRLSDREAPTLACMTDLMIDAEIADFINKIKE